MSVENVYSCGEIVIVENSVIEDGFLLLTGIIQDHDARSVQ